MPQLCAALPGCLQQQPLQQQLLQQDFLMLLLSTQARQRWCKQSQLNDENALVTVARTLQGYIDQRTLQNRDRRLQYGSMLPTDALWM
jgi:hypothetical protein